MIAIALAFDFLNGFHDAANSIATVVSTRVLPPSYAVAWAAFFNFVAFAILGTRVARTIGGDLVKIELIEQIIRRRERRHRRRGWRRFCTGFRGDQQSRRDNYHRRN